MIKVRLIWRHKRVLLLKTTQEKKRCLTLMRKRQKHCGADTIHYTPCKAIELHTCQLVTCFGLMMFPQVNSEASSHSLLPQQPERIQSIQKPRYSFKTCVALTYNILLQCVSACKQVHFLCAAETSKVTLLSQPFCSFAVFSSTHKDYGKQFLSSLLARIS